MQKNSTHLITKECNGTANSETWHNASSMEEAFSIKNHTFPSNRRILQLKTVYNRAF